jgi:hypothetical protein
LWVGAVGQGEAVRGDGERERGVVGVEIYNKITLVVVE